MRTPADLLTSMGEKLTALPDRTRLWLSVLALLLLIGCSVYKLIGSIKEARKPPVPASTRDMLEPTQKLFQRTSYGDYQRHKQHTMSRLDSLAKVYFNKKQH
ncbi:hypothetical protein GCM10023189_44710 [Nibrella saemangeumensis]|uniref:Uncharacterized protein n=1 Tax=Nibrella saemangeumensis TaxID=1084526 RepID=A0ABP8NF45_9BACT